MPADDGGQPLHSVSPGSRESSDITVVSGPSEAGLNNASYLYARDLLREGEIILPKGSKLVAQLRSVKFESLPGGRIRSSYRGDWMPVTPTWSRPG